MEPLTNVLTLELSFGDENTISKNEFLLVRPRDMVVNNAGDIFVVDEDRVKLFGNDGKEKLIFGRSGQGPGEFTRADDITIGPQGYVTVMDNVGYGVFNIFSSDYSFVEKVNLKNIQKYIQFIGKNKWASFFVNKVYSINEEERIVKISISQLDKNEVNYETTLLLHETPDTLFEITRYRSLSYNQFIIDERMYRRGFAIAYQGSLIWVVTDDKRVIFTHTSHDFTINSNSAHYWINIYSLDTCEITKITHRYTPVDIPDELKDWYYQSFKDMNEPIMAEKSKKLMKDSRYFPPIEDIFCDKNLLFVKLGKNPLKKDYLYDIIDLNSGEFYMSIIVPDSLDFYCIKNGYAYRLKTGRDIFTVVEKYRIDPTVYGK